MPGTVAALRATVRDYLRTATPASTVPYIVTLLPLPASLDVPASPAQAVQSKTVESVARQIKNRFTRFLRRRAEFNINFASVA